MSTAASRMLAVVAVLGVVATAVVLLDNRSTTRTGSAQLSGEREGRTPHVTAPSAGVREDHALRMEDARRQIAADSQGGVHEATVQAAPIQPSYVAAPVPTAPDGYSFTAAPTQMAVAEHRPTPGGGTEPTQDHTQGLGWLFGDADASGAPLAAIPALARQMQRDWVFGWLRLADGAQPQDARNDVAPLGIDVLAAAGRLLRVRLPADAASLAAATALPSVSGLGVMPPERKAHETFRAEVHAAPSRQLPVLITLMAHDQDGRWRRALLARGVEVGRFDADTRAYTANVDATAFDAALEADFVLAIEPMPMFQASHDSAVPAMGADAVRSHGNAPGLFRGTTGSGVPIGVMDTGLNINHLDIASHRSSICGANFVAYEHRAEDADLWVDQDGHGTHVTGTIAGNGFVEPRYAGMAPGVARIRFAKVLNRGGSGFFSEISRGMDFLTRASACGNDAVAAKPLIVNMSLSGNSRRWQGRTTGERKLDTVVWGHRQLYVVANSNASIHGFSNYGAAKNSLSVGAAYDDGELATFSSWGPTFDGRLAPQLVATGVDVYSARGQGSRGGYVRFSGTSMAAPTVAGVAALLMDAVAGYREQPALTRARLMASAVKPDAWLDASGAFPSNNSRGPGALQAQYGLGKASGRTSVLQRQRTDGWENGAATSTMTAGSYGFQDIVVPEGTSRLDLVLTWDEPPADTIGSTVLNDLDLWLDRGADCDTNACGEYSSRSRRDNVEWIIVKNPAPGTYRARAVPRRIYTAPPRAGLAWTIIRGASTPSLRVTVDGRRRTGDRQYRVALTVSVDAYVAAGVQVSVHGCRAADGTECSPDVEVLPARAEDGVQQSPPSSSRDDHALVGEVGVGERQRIEFDVDLGTITDPVRLYFTANAWNANPALASVAFAAPGGSQTEPPAEVAPPANDHFADAVRLAASGNVNADLTAATFEPGEPNPRTDERSSQRSLPSRSIWYRWTARTAGPVRFSTSGAHVDVLQGERMAALTQIAGERWSASFFAEARETYLVRVSCGVYYSESCALAQTLRWSQGPRPANDDFAAAEELLDAEGEVAGDNSGASLDPGERVGGGAATVWYRWTAPEDGAWRFTADDADSKVLAFTGDHVAALRLVAGDLQNSVVCELRVQAGTEYHIAVAALDASGKERAFTLMWEKYERPADADDLAHAAELYGTTGSESLWAGASVEPGEPPQTGVRTRWSVWTAPASGRFTWHLDTRDTEINVSVFALADAADADATPSLAALELLASTGPEVTGTELAFDALIGQRYWISVGFHTGDDAAFGSGFYGTLKWGETPANDTLAQAITIEGGSGSTTFANRFGTLDPGERNGVLGASSLWWSFTPAMAGWHRFWLDGATSATLAIYRVRGAGLDGLELVARSHGDWQAPGADDAVAAVFDATAEQRYMIRVGQRGEREDVESTLSWEETDAPMWLRYVGRQRAATLGLGAPGTDETPAATFEDRGAVLYVATTEGVHVLRRNAVSGTLTRAQVLNMKEPQALLWDPGASKLYALVDCRLRRLAPGDEARRTLVDEGVLERMDGPELPCNSVRAAFLDPSGAFVYFGHLFGIDAYAIGETGLTAVQSVTIDHLEHAMANWVGTAVYATNGWSLQVFTRDADTGRLTAAGEVSTGTHFPAIAISDDDAYLMGLALHGPAEAYELKTASGVPRRLNTLAEVGNATWRDTRGDCRFMAARGGSAAFDAFCRNSAFSAAIRVAESADEATRLEATDYVANWQADRFNNYIPEFKSQALAASPDGRHAYVYSEGDILIFERIGNQPLTERTASGGQ